MARLSLLLLRAGCRLAALWLLGTAGAAFAAPPHMALEVELDPATRHFHASARLASERLPDFVLHPGLAISRATVDGVAVAPADLQHLAPAAGEHRFAIEYGGTLPPLPAIRQQSPNPGSFYAAPQGSYLAPEARWYPDPGVPFTYTLTLKLPRGQKGLVPGRQLREYDS
ncbi:MAG TPA: hypothetical protein VKD22_15915, partial [Ramlibacter sp.]|nr:hypothetical protein [Ramlibacter sp.]